MTTVRCIAGLFGCAFLIGLSACASHRTTGVHRAAVERDAVVTVTAVDVPNRLVTVRPSSGDEFTVYVDKANTAFPQAKVGDQVRVRYVDSLALRLTKAPATSGISVKEETAQPAPGRAKGEASTEISAVVRIESVKSDGSLVTFTGPRGRRTVQVRDPATRDYVKQLRAGDHVEATYKEALALSLEKV